MEDDLPEHVTTVTIDETGDAGKKGNGDDPLFAMTAMITESHEDMENIARWFRRIRNVPELKASKTDDDRIKIIRPISRLKPEIYGTYIDRTAPDNPRWWNEYRNRKIVFRLMFSEIVNETFSRTEKNDLIVIVDFHKHIGNGLGETIVRTAAEEHGKNIIEFRMEDSQAGEYRDLIQANDYVTYSVREKIAHKDRVNFDLLGIELKRITSENTRTHEK